MSGSFIEDLQLSLPKSVITRVSLGIGMLGIAGLSVVGGLLIYSRRTSQVDIQVTSANEPPQLEVLELKTSPIPSLVAAPASSPKTSVNNASLEELLLLPVIGQKRAEKIISGRPYTTIEDFYAKNGLGEKQQAELNDLIEI